MVALSFRKQLAINDDSIRGIVNDTQDGILDIVLALNNSPIIQGVLIQNVALSTTASLVSHFLGYTPRGFIVVDKTSSVDVYRDATATNPNTGRFIALRTSAGSATVSLWIF